MGHWNYRVVLREYADGRDPTYGIYEAFYDDEGALECITEEPVPVYADTLEKLEEELDWIRRALEAPVLAYEGLAPVG